MDPDNDTTTDDGLTEIERAEVAADAAPAMPAAEVVAADPAPAAAVAEDPAATNAKALTDAAGAITEAAKALASASAARAEPAAATTATPARDYDAEISALREQYKTGAIDEDEKEEKLEKLLEERSDFRTQQTIDRRLNEASQASVQASWERTVLQFNADPTNAALFENDVRHAAFNAQVHTAAKANPTGTHAQWLNAAKATTLAAFGVTDAASQDAGKKAADAVKAAADARAKAAGKTAPTLDRAPNAGSNTATGPDAQLDNLDISDLEDTLARMPADKLDAYLSSAPGGLRDNPRAV